jgi:hypothetical protein
MHQAYASQYGTACVVIEDGDKASEVVEYAGEIGAVTNEGKGEVFVVRFPGSRGPECYSKDALRRSFRKRYVRETIVPGVAVTFFTEEQVPEGKVTSVGGLVPHSGHRLTVAPIGFGDHVVQGFSVHS